MSRDSGGGGAKHSGGGEPVDERRLNIFRVVAEQRSFSRAAALLHLSQPTVSQQIQALEAHYGVRLFDRSSKYVALTAAGRALYTQVEALLREYAEARRAVLQAAGAVSGPLTLGASQTIGEYILPRAIAAFQGDHPKVKVRLQIQNTEQIESLMLGGRLDMGLVEGPVSSSELTQVNFSVDHLVVITPPNHPWREKAAISLADLKGERLVIREAGSGTRRVMEAALLAAGTRLEEFDVMTELAGMEAIKGAVEAGMGVACLSHWVIRKELRLGTLLSFTIRGVPMQRTLRVVYPSGHSLVPAAAAFLRLLQSPELLQIVG